MHTQNWKLIIFTKPVNRFWLVLATFLIAMLITLMVIAVRTHFLGAIFLLIVFPISILEFPTGLISILTGNYGYIPNEVIQTLFVILIYLGISSVIIFTVNERVSRILYLLLALLLILNIVGCSISAPIRMSGIN